ncbi:hypothetical protein [Paraburkholderia adhaesiva]|uniref:hypothetical protein n=1 Tax=Paraburkholderia adhaesiva TaxID=2883244 RepID=UPI001F1B4B6C|nr:hypothetical protein [Paraburkholderia adhaesiva]
MADSVEKLGIGRLARAISLYEPLTECPAFRGLPPEQEIAPQAHYASPKAIDAARATWSLQAGHDGPRPVLEFFNKIGRSAPLHLDINPVFGAAHKTKSG